MSKYKGKIINFWKDITYKSPPEPPYSHMIQIGDPRLRTKSELLDLTTIKTENVKKIIGNMTRIMDFTKIPSLSAIQIGCPVRIFGLQVVNTSAFSTEEVKMHKIQEVPLQIWINPEIDIIDAKQISFREYCGSTLGYGAEVKRYKSILLRGYDETGQVKSMQASGFTARLIQHELDHLNGILFTDIMNPKTFHCTHWDLINNNSGQIKLTYVPKHIK